MVSTLPGTTLPRTSPQGADAFGMLKPIFAVSPGGLLLSQVAELTGLSGSTIQNWVKRGWVSRPDGKKYGERQIARILLINLLRPAMQLEDIVRLLRFINGSVEDRSDDIISEDSLYSLLCSAIDELESGRNLSAETIETLVRSRLEGYIGPTADAARRLTDAVCLMLLNVAASLLMQRASVIYQSSIAPAIASPAPVESTETLSVKEVYP